MITLKNLHLATEQQVFDQVARHLLAQMRVSTNEHRCLYRTFLDDGTVLKCAAGCLISDDEYIREMETSWSYLVNYGLIPTNNCSVLIIELQKLHDNFDPVCWKTELYNIADRFNLNTEVLNEF